MKNLISSFALLIALLFSASSCQKIVLGEDEINNPENNFELLWKDFDQHYGLFTVRKTNWDSLYKVYRPKVTSTTTNDELWKICTQLIEHLDDSHTVLFVPNKDSGYISGYALNQKSKLEFSKALVADKYLDYKTDIVGEKSFAFGKIKSKDIGYIYLGAELGNNPAKIDAVIDSLKKHKAIIFDMRQNGGGDDKYAARIAGAFADNEKLIYTVQTRNGLKHTDFDAKTAYFTRKQGAQQFLKPVIVLTDRRVISAGEVLLLHLKSFKQVVQIGDTTAGDFSDLSNRRFLPNGWTYQYSPKMYLLPDGKSLDGIGHIPDVYIKNTQADINANTDKVMEKGIQFLMEKYGIQ
jgi:carboxyl-terminal processing protease